MRVWKSYFLPVLIVIATFVSGCATPQAAEEQNAQAKVAMQDSVSPETCPSKWVAAGNNGAKAGRYFKVSCS